MSHEVSWCYWLLPFWQQNPKGKTSTLRNFQSIFFQTSSESIGEIFASNDVESISWVKSLRVKFLLVKFLWTWIDYFLHFLAHCMFTLKFWGNNYSGVEQNLLPGSKKGGKFQSKLWEIPPGGILLLNNGSWNWPLDWEWEWSSKAQ